MQSTLLGVFLIFSCSAAYPKGILLEEPHPDTGLDPVELITKYGYPVESHIVVTEDGYILTALRIPHGLNIGDSNTNRPPVLLVHGILSSAADWINMGSNSLGFILADAGYDVWLANARGTEYSRNHTSLDPDVNKAEFWNYSWHEIGMYDLPAVIDHVLGTSGEENLHYVGHSQGCTSFLVMTSVRPEYNEKIKIAALLAPAAILENNNVSLLQMAARNLPEIEAFLNSMELYEIPFLSVVREVGSAYCWQPNFTDICLNIMGTGDTAELDPARLSVISTNNPNGASFKQIYHYVQQLANGGFSQYDYGAEKNYLLYGMTSPPAYDLSKIRAPVALYYGNNDQVADPLDVEILASKLPNLVRLFKVKYELFNHVDFTYAIDVKEFLYNDVVKDLDNF